MSTGGDCGGCGGKTEGIFRALLLSKKVKQQIIIIIIIKSYVNRVYIGSYFRFKFFPSGLLARYTFLNVSILKLA